jgi:hypothetical protein
MPPCQHPCVTPAEAISYRSSSCRIGTHHTCTESSPATAPIDVPVIYEVCDCSCHEVARQAATLEVTR